MNITIDRAGRPDISENQLFELIYSGRDKHIVTKNSNNAIKKYNQLSSDWGFPVEVKFLDTSLTDQQYISQCVENWPMPDNYKSIDLEQYFASKISTIEQAERISNELELFEKFNLISVLKFIIFLVDKMRENKIVWGVGRGSSIASYCLFLIGLHKIDSLKYDLDITEFLK